MYPASGPFAFFCAAMLVATAWPAEAGAPDLLDLSLEELLMVEVVAGSGLAQALPADAAVVADDIRLRTYRAIADALLNFTRFIEWPDEAGGGDFRICVGERDPFGPELDALATRSVRTRPVRVERRVSRFGACQLVFVPAGAPLPPPSGGMLVVAEDAEALTQGAVIVVGLEGRRIAFDINPQAAARAGLRISYKLLRLARSNSAKPAAKATGPAAEGR